MSSTVPKLPEDLPERFKVLKQQEMTSYKVEDYLNPNYSVPIADIVKASDCPMCSEADGGALTAVSDSISIGTNSSSSGVNEDWRSKICEWSYQVIDHFDYDREIVAVSLSYLDRYLCKRPVNKRTFQLVAMTTLYLACKLYDPNKLRMSSLIELSRGYFTEDHITAMEESILNKLSWQVHPPTPLTFARHFVLLLKPRAMTPHLWHDMMEVAKFLTELAVIDYHFAPLRNSSVGLAALMTAMEGLSQSTLSEAHRQEFAENVYRVAHVNPNDPEVLECRTRLRTMYYEGGVYQQQQEAEAAANAEAAQRARDPVASRLAADTTVSVSAHPVVVFPLKNQAQRNEANVWGPASPADPRIFAANGAGREAQLAAERESGARNPAQPVIVEIPLQNQNHANPRNAASEPTLGNHPPVNESQADEDSSSKKRSGSPSSIVENIDTSNAAPTSEGKKSAARNLDVEWGPSSSKEKGCQGQDVTKATSKKSGSKKRRAAGPLAETNSAKTSKIKY